MKRASTPHVSSAGTDALAAYEAWMRERENLATASIRNYVSDLSHFIAWYEQRADHPAGDDGVLFSPREITTAVLLGYRDVLQEREQKPTSINRALLSLKRYFHWAFSQQLVSSDPSVPIKLVGETAVAPRQLSEQEELALIEATSRYGTLRDRTMILLLLHTGLRASEICGLRLDQITLGKDSGQLCVVDARNNTRSVPLDATAHRALQEYLPLLPASAPWVFLSEKTQKALSERALGYIIKKYADLAHVADVSPHDLRHRFGYRMAATTPLPELAQMMGHASVDTTRLYFTHPAQPGTHTPAPPSQSPGQVQSARNDLEAALKDPLTGPGHPSGTPAGHPSGWPQASLLLPKLRPPRLPALFVSRQRLLARLEEGRQGKLTLLLAPAGSGKTTLVRQWIDTQDQGIQSAWLSLDPEDDDPIRFWHYVLTACERFEGKPGHDALQQLSTNQSFFTLLFLKTILTSFLNNVAQQASRLQLVLDDYHVITSSQIHESLAYLVDHLPPTLHVVILTRAEPALPLARWRARGDLQEIHATDLRFSLEEMTSFLHQALPFQLPAERLQSLEAHLEGWPAGFRLLALALAGKSERQEIEQVLAGFSGSHRYLLDYFALEVLSSQPEARQLFLLQTSLLGRMTASLCDAVTGSRDSEQALREIERSGLFLQALGGEPPWYRYHALFAEALQAQARQRLRKEERRLCLSRASAWYEQEELFAEGIEAALAAGEWERAAALMERVLKVQNHPAMQERVTLLRWLEMLPDLVLEAHPGLCVHYAAALLFTLDRSSPATMALIEEPLNRAERSYEREEAWGKLGEALSCHAEVARWQGDIPQAMRLARRALSLPPEPPMLWRGASILIIVRSELLAGRPEEARRLILEGQKLFETLQIPGYSVHGATQVLGEICLQQGRLHQAEQYYRQLLVTAKENLVDQMTALFGMARVSYEWNHLAEAEQSVAQVLEIGKAHLDELGKYFVQAGFFFPAELLQARLYQARGNLLQAQQALQKLLAFAQEHQLTAYSSMVLAQQVELSLTTGLLPSSEDWPMLSHPPYDTALAMQQEQEDLLRARFLIVRGEITEALHLLGRWQEEAHTWRRIRSELEIHVLLSLAYAASSRPAQARQALKEALILAQPEGFQRLFLEKGEPLSTLLRTLLLDLREEPLVSYARDLLLAFASLKGEQQVAPHTVSALLLEPLTDAEQRVLGLLAGGRTNSEIAAAQVVSINTVKTQVQSIYRKLNVKSRWEAREAAHRLDLL
ncbi:MAG TPA: tyrosine-type recombinase/integrase [Ktedonosporobacter sp.]|nr:tyrosine-type recombinase/integrase [Ktedonosporobacter sp.]